MRFVSEQEIQSLNEYEKNRDIVRPKILQAKSLRRVHLGEYLTFLFENHDTIWYQVQEILRIEKNIDPTHVRHELDTYNELIGQPGELGCTLLIEITDSNERDRLLKEWNDLPGSLYLETIDGKRIPAQFDERQVGDRRISSVHYLRFQIGDKVLKSVGCDHPDIKLSYQFSNEQILALTQDLMAK